MWCRRSSTAAGSGVRSGLRAGASAAGLVRSGVAADRSLGYAVDVRQSAPDQLRAGHKRVLEVSLVRKGAREGCHIVGYDGDDGFVPCNTAEQAWQHFDLTRP